MHSFLEPKSEAPSVNRAMVGELPDLAGRERSGRAASRKQKEEAPLYNKDCVNQSWIRLKVLCFFIINSFGLQNKVLCLNENKKYKIFFYFWSYKKDKVIYKNI